MIGNLSDTIAYMTEQLGLEDVGIVKFDSPIQPEAAPQDGGQD